MHMLKKNCLFTGIWLIALPGILLFSPAMSCHRSDRFVALENGFISPPDSIRIGAYWYWINDNISQEGVVQDLHAMKKAGITRVFIGNMGKLTWPWGDWKHPSPPYGKVKFMSEEWWKVIHTALKTATGLDIEIGIFNSPGWSQSGGPWVKPEQSMRYLASAEVHVTGPRKFSERLLPPEKNRRDVENYLDAADAHLGGSNRFSDRMWPLVNHFQDVKVLAFPAQPGNRKNLFLVYGAKTVYSAGIRNPSVDLCRLPSDGDSHITLVLPQSATARSLMIYPGDYLSADAEFQIKKDNSFHTVKRFHINRTHDRPIQGYDPHSPVVVSFPEVNAPEYRVVFHSVKPGSAIASLILTPTFILERYPEKIMAKMSPDYGWGAYLWEAQSADGTLAVDPAQVLDISDCLSADGTIEWDVPEGEWIIMRTGMMPTGVVNNPASPEATGLETDKTSRQHAIAHFDAFLGQILKRIPAADRKSWKVSVMDSYETGGQNFTDDMLIAFMQRYGYDPTPFLPVYQGYPVKSPELSDRFLWDMRRLIADRVAYEYVAGIREASHQYGLTSWLENYGHWGFPGEFLQYGGQSDEVSGEFWGNGNFPEKIAAVSCAHIYGKNKVWAESFTGTGNAYQRHPAALKCFGDRAFSEGVNASLFHVYIHQPVDSGYPGIDAWFNTEFNRKNTWFSHLDLFTLYMRRCNFMLQQGLNVADVAYFIGEDTPKMSGIVEPELPEGYHFDFINSEVLIRDLAVKDGRLVLPHGTSYRLLVLPPQETMRPEVLQKLEKLVAGGAVILGSPPNRSPSMEHYPEADKLVRELAGNMWGDVSVKQRSYGKGMILKDMNMTEVLDLLNVIPDCRVNTEDPVLYAHRTLNEGEIYFISNQSEKTVRINPQFRAGNMKPELWDAVTGHIRPLPSFTQNEATTTVPLQLEACESAFIVFRTNGKPLTSELEANYPQPEIVAEVTTPWEVRFNPDEIRRGIAGVTVFDKLQDWSTHEDERIKYYSGTALYKNIFTMPKPLSGDAGNHFFAGQRIYLDLGKVSVMAKVKINGRYVGGVWTPPYRTDDITPFLTEGDNEIEVEVVNTWVNRIIGDLQLPEENRRVIPGAHSWKADSPLQESGLLGPVRIVSVKQ
ncbi:MAG: glycoside hydrolase family 2 [Tannerella sp.]|nr:glycoside hydrolase family 2 [Tannerella sp.]